MYEILKPKITALREQLGYPEMKGSLEDRVVYIKRQIYFMNLSLNRFSHHDKAKSPHQTQTQSHAHKAESEHSAKPSLSPSERLRASLSSRNAAHT